MNWHYVEGSEARGPVTDAELEALISSGSVGPHTLVWHEGMAEWLTCSQVQDPRFAAFGPSVPPVAAPPGQVLCAECGRPFPPEDVIRHGDQFICSACKPVFLQKLKEGVTPVPAMRYAGFWIRFCARFLDGLIVAVPVIAFEFGVISVLGRNSQIPAFFINTSFGTIVGCSYSTFFVGKYGATLGKMATGLRVVNPDGSKVSYGKAAGRYFAVEYVSGCFTLCIGYLMAAWDSEKRALHDRICNTRVIQT